MSNCIHGVERPNALTNMTKGQTHTCSDEPQMVWVQVEIHTKSGDTAVQIFPQVTYSVSAPAKAWR